MIKKSHKALLRRAVKKAGTKAALAEYLGYAHRSIVNGWEVRGLPVIVRLALEDYVK